MMFADKIVVHPRRDVTGFRPFKALHHMRKLMADKEDTKQAFFIIEALRGRRGLRKLKHFFTTDEAGLLLTCRDDLVQALDDHDRWADCAPNSLAQHYVRFMQREKLSAAGLVADSFKVRPDAERYDDLYQWYADRLRDVHDLSHVLTGYGRDPLGESCLLAFGYEQNLNPGVLFIATMSGRRMKRESGIKRPVDEAIAEGRRLGRAARTIVHQDVLSLLPLDIDEVRERLNIGRPDAYERCLARFASLTERDGNWKPQPQAA